MDLVYLVNTDDNKSDHICFSNKDTFRPLPWHNGNLFLKQQECQPFPFYVHFAIFAPLWHFAPSQGSGHVDVNSRKRRKSISLHWVWTLLAKHVLKKCVFRAFLNVRCVCTIKDVLKFSQMSEFKRSCRIQDG